MRSAMGGAELSGTLNVMARAPAANPRAARSAWVGKRNAPEACCGRARNLSWRCNARLWMAERSLPGQRRAGAHPRAGEHQRQDAHGRGNPTHRPGGWRQFVGRDPPGQPAVQVDRLIARQRPIAISTESETADRPAVFLRLIDARRRLPSGHGKPAREIGLRPRVGGSGES
jgi:hypothetical protein